MTAMTDTTEQTLLLFGPTGQIGFHLQTSLSNLGSVVTCGRTDIDLNDSEALRRRVREMEPDVVINAAAYTAVDDAEEEQEEARAVNAVAPGVLAEVTEEVGGWFVHYSTDYVFDGSKTTPYVETDPTNPVNVYGRTKRAGEKAVQEVDGRHLLLRTSWVYSNRRSNFLRSMLRLADEHDRLTVVDDQTGTPTWAGWIAEATATILQRLQEAESPEDVRGLYHLAAAGQTSWYSFARSIFAQFGRDDVVVEPIPSAEYETVAARPAYTVLDSTKARQTFGLRIPTWSEQLDAFRRQLDD